MCKREMGWRSFEECLDISRSCLFFLINYSPKFNNCPSVVFLYVGLRGSLICLQMYIILLKFSRVGREISFAIGMVRRLWAPRQTISISMPSILER